MPLALLLAITVACNGSRTSAAPDMPEPEPAAEPGTPAEPVVPSAPGEPAEPSEPGTPAAPAEPAVCGGIAGFQCPDKSACMDDPNDACDPDAGGRDCMGVCVACNDERLRRNYLDKDPGRCARVKLICDKGQTFFSDSCGCGCVDPPEGGAPPKMPALPKPDGQ